jgi:hypothetical protein
MFIHLGLSRVVSLVIVLVFDHDFKGSKTISNLKFLTVTLICRANL